MISKRLKIAQVAPLWFSIPPRKYGGTERIINLLTEELVKRGHKVTLFASGDSKTKAKLFSITEKNLRAQNIPWHDWWWNTLNHSLVFEIAQKFDIIHCHWNFLGAFFQKFIKTPVLHTLHNTPKARDHRWQVINYLKKDLNVVFLSKKQQKNAPIKFKKEMIVYNGIDISQFRFQSNPKDYFLWVGRISSAKGVENAIVAAKKARVKLLIAGPVQTHYQDYFDKKIKPQISKQIKYLGELPAKELVRIYGSARALLYPIEWEEPFGLVVIEAMACGTPVIAFNHGSMRELIKNDFNGFVVKNISEMVKRIKVISRIKRENCRKWVEKNFSHQKMVDNYEKIYYSLVK